MTLVAAMRGVATAAAAAAAVAATIAVLLLLLLLPQKVCDPRIRFRTVHLDARHRRCCSHALGLWLLEHLFIILWRLRLLLKTLLLW
jgi:hypothetical protein